MPERSNDQSTPTDALRLVPDDHLAALIQQADDGFGYSMEMVRLVDGVRTYRLKIAGQDPSEITDGDDNDYDAQQACYRLINAAKNKVRADAVRTALAAAPASPLPGGVWRTDFENAPDCEDGILIVDATKISPAVGTARFIDGEWCGYDHGHGVECLWPSPTHWMPLPAAPTGEAK